MMGGRKALGLGLMIVLALSLVGVSTASAAEFHSGSASGTTYLSTGQIGTNQLDTTGGNIKCTTVSLVGQYVGTTAASIEAAPTYSGCTAFGLTAHIEVNGCYFLFTNTATPSIDLVCPAGKGPIVVRPTQGGVAVCTVDIPAGQTINAKVTNVAGATDDLEITPESSAIKYTVTYPGTGTKCGPAGEQVNGKQTGSLTTRAFADLARTVQVNLTYN